MKKRSERADAKLKEILRLPCTQSLLTKLPVNARAQGISRSTNSTGDTLNPFRRTSLYIIRTQQCFSSINSGISFCGHVRLPRRRFPLTQAKTDMPRVFYDDFPPERGAKTASASFRNSCLKPLCFEGLSLLTG